MGEDSGLQGRAGALTDRRGERGVLDQLIDAVRAGGSRVLVVRGEPGVGKSALLEYLAGRAAGCRVARAVGVQSEMELAFAGLHQLLSPVLDRAGRAPMAATDEALPGLTGRVIPPAGEGKGVLLFEQDGNSSYWTNPPGAHRTRQYLLAPAGPGRTRPADGHQVPGCRHRRGFSWSAEGASPGRGG